MSAAMVEPIDEAVIYVRDGGLCGICGEPVAPEEVTLDHVVPLARGGPHAPTNVQIAHHLCNCTKGARMPTPQEVAALAARL
jgi:5-methylcytosine-specific restriction endonuclease McrA